MSRLNFIQRENLRLWNLCQCYVTGCYGAPANGVIMPKK